VEADLERHSRNNGVVNVIREHFRNPNLLLVGTVWPTSLSTMAKTAQVDREPAHDAS
jgi:hypothetical protein